MSPKRRYQTSSIELGLGAATNPSSSLTPSHHFPPHAEFFYGSASQTSYNRPITPAEIAVNPCLTHRKLGPRATQREVVEGSHSPSRQAPSNAQTSSSNAKGNRTYRVRHHHQNRYELPMDSNSPRSKPQPVGGSLSQGIFGLPVIQDYLRNYQPEQKSNVEEQKMVETSADMPQPHSSVNKLTETKPRMKITLPSYNHNQPPTPTSVKDKMMDMDMGSVLQVGPVSRSRTRPEQASNHSSSHANTSGKKGARRRVQSSGAHHVNSGHSHNLNTPHSVHQFPRSSTLTPTAPVENDRSDRECNIEFVDTMLQDCLTHLKSSDWEQICDAFHKIQHLTSEYPAHVNPFLKRIIWSGIPHVASSRTKVSRSACQCFKKLYETQRRSMEGEGDKVFKVLLELSGGPHNKFIQNECKEALIAAVQNTDSQKCINLIEQHGSKHRNANVREFAAFLLSEVIDQLQMDKVMSKEFAHKVLPLIVGFLLEGQLNTRLNAKECLGKIIDHPDFDYKLRRYVSPENVRHITGTLRKMRGQR